MKAVWIPFGQPFKWPKAGGLLLSFDPNIRRKLWGSTDYVPLLRELTMQSDIVMLGFSEAEALFGVRDTDAIFDRLLDSGRIKYAAVKNGEEGAWVTDGRRRLKIPPYPCRCIEPIGAGDGFNAGFLAGILQNGDVEKAGRMGCICGALATQTTGDVEGYPDAIQMEAALSGTQMLYR